MKGMKRRQRIKALKEAAGKRGKCTGCCCCNQSSKGSNIVIHNELNKAMFSNPRKPDEPGDFNPGRQVIQTHY